MLVTALFVGAGPALRASKANVVVHLKEGSGATLTGGRFLGLDARAVLVGGQMSLALMLLIGAGLIGNSVRHLMGVEEGFSTSGLLTFDYSQPQSIPAINYMDVGTLADRISLAAEFDDELVQRLTSLPGVEAAAVGCGVLKGYCAVIGVMAVEGKPDFEGTSNLGVITAHDRYFETLGIPILRGRGFGAEDGFDSSPVVVLSATAAETFFPAEDPLGQRLSIGFSVPGREMAEVVGVVGDVLFDGPDEEGIPVAYFSNRERRFASHAIVRTTGRPAVAVSAIRAELNDLEPTMAISGVATVEELVNQSTGGRRMLLGLLGLFSSITILLAAVGAWGVVAYSVADRKAELSLRMALGAERNHVVALVVRKTALTTVLGMAVGLGGAWAGTRLLESFLWETSSRDPATFLGGSGLLFAVVVLATYLPARRATRLDPAEALKAE